MDVKTKAYEAAKKAAEASLDGFARSAEGEEEINQLFRRIFNSPEGQKVLNYLKNITTNVVMPAGVPDSVLHRMEGKREIVGIIDMRRDSKPFYGDDGKTKKKPN